MAGNDGVETSDPEVAARPTHPLVDAVHIVAHRVGWGVLEAPAIACFASSSASTQPCGPCANMGLAPSLFLGFACATPVS